MTQLRMKTGRVYLIGAGPGDPKLLTLKAAEALAVSDVVVYDYLVNPEVLAHTRRGSELIYAGKRAGEKSLSQSAINQLLIDHATEGRVVARLKGGDPFVFGRGGEEAEALVEAGIKWEVIPGVSSGVAAAAYAGIPLTHRGYASSVAFITGHEADDKLSGVDLRAAAHADTLVVFMCGGTIAKIASELIAIGRSPSTPIAIIRWGTHEHQEIYAGALENIACERGASNELKIKPPAIAIVGDVVSLQEKLRWFGDESSRHSLRELYEEEPIVTVAAR
jgi:uroporphyrin-III C-methyltransferase